MSTRPVLGNWKRVAMVSSVCIMGLATFCVVRLVHYYSKPSVDFYGQVVDDSGRPVQGAEVIVSVWWEKGSHASDESGNLTLLTDSSGRFAIRNARGVGLAISNIRKPGYEWVVDWAWGPAADDWLTKDNRYYFYDRKSFPSNPIYRPDESHPAVFPLFAEGSQQLAMPSRGGSDEYSDGRVVQGMPIVPVIPSLGRGSPKRGTNEKEDRLREFALKARTPGGAKPSQSNFNKIQDGMTTAQVEAIMGPPKYVEAGTPEVAPFADKFYLWESGRELYSIGFRDGKAVKKYFSIAHTP